MDLFILAALPIVWLNPIFLNTSECLCNLIGSCRCDMRRYKTAVAREREQATHTRYSIHSKMRSLIDSKPVGNNLETVELFTTKICIFIKHSSCEVFKNENKGIVYSICRVFIVWYNTRYHYFSVKQLGLRLFVLLKIMVSPVLYQTIDTRQLLITECLLKWKFLCQGSNIQLTSFTV